MVHKLVRDIKKSKISGKRQAVDFLLKFEAALSAVLVDAAYSVIPYEECYRFYFDLLHNSQSAIGPGVNRLEKSTIDVSCLESFFLTMSASMSSERVLVFSNYPKEMPYTEISLRDFSRQYKLFLDLYEDDISIFSEDLSQYLSVSTDSMLDENTAEIKVVGCLFDGLIELLPRESLQ